MWINFCVYKNQPLRFSLLNNSENKNQFTIKNIQLYPAYDEQYSLPPKVTETRKLQVNIPDLKEKEGTLSFWFQPNWPALAGNFHGRTRKTFLQIPNFLRLEYYLEHPQLKLKDGRKEITIGYDWKQAHQRQWQAYTWHHWAITWKNNRVKNYFLTM